MKEITVTLHIGGEQVEKLTPGQVQKIADRLSESMSEYYSNHITEFQKIKSMELAERESSSSTVNGPPSPVLGKA